MDERCDLAYFSVVCRVFCAKVVGATSSEGFLVSDDLQVDNLRSRSLRLSGSRVDYVELVEDLRHTVDLGVRNPRTAHLCYWAYVFARSCRSRAFSVGLTAVAPSVESR